MTEYMILILCIIVIVAYIFDITSKYSRIPGIILLIFLGIATQIVSRSLKINVPNLESFLPVVGTLGLIMIIMEASLDLKLDVRKKELIAKSIISAVGLFIISTAILSYAVVHFFDYNWRTALLNIIPLCIISSSVAIPSSLFLLSHDKEFIVYESSISDVFGIIVFGFVLNNEGNIGAGILYFGLSTIVTLVISIITSSILALLLHKIKYHINYVIIMASVVMMYMLAKLVHLPALLLVLAFGLVLSNNQLLEHTFVRRVFNFTKFRSDLGSFKMILTELTFIVRSFFFIMFGYYAKIEGLLDINNILTGLVITTVIFIVRLIFIKLVLKMPAVPLLFFSPRGLITILLFVTIPGVLKIPMLGEEVVTIVILFSIIFMMIGNIFYKKEIKLEDESTKEGPIFPVNI
jgi:cell volume regulation protein A